MILYLVILFQVVLFNKNNSPNESARYDTKQSDGEVPAVLEL